VHIFCGIDKLLTANAYVVRKFIHDCSFKQKQFSSILKP